MSGSSINYSDRSDDNSIILDTEDIIPDEDEEYLIEEDNSLGELESNPDKYFNEDEALEDEDNESFVENPFTITNTKTKNKNLFLTKEKLFYNRMSRNEYIQLNCHLALLYSKGLYPQLKDKKYLDNFEEVNIETLSLLSLLKQQSNIFCLKEDSIYNVSNYPINDLINNFKYYYKYQKEYDFIYKTKVIEEDLPNLIKNLDNIRITKEEINDCIEL